MRGRFVIVLLVALGLTGCKTIVSIGVHKDWCVEGHPLDHPSIYRPDMKTSAELRFEKDWK